jgi:hypothetical protein
MSSITFDKDLQIFVTPQGSKATQADILGWAANNPTEFNSTGKEVVKTAGNNLLKMIAGLGTPFAVGTTLAYDTVQDIKAGKPIDDIVADPFKTASLIAMEPASKALGLAEKSGIGRLLTLGLPSRVLSASTPVGLGLTAATLGYQGAKNVYGEYKRRQGLSEEERMAEDVMYEQQQKELGVSP